MTGSAEREVSDLSEVSDSADVSDVTSGTAPVVSDCTDPLTLTSAVLLLLHPVEKAAAAANEVMNASAVQYLLSVIRSLPFMGINFLLLF